MLTTATNPTREAIAIPGVNTQLIPSICPKDFSKATSLLRDFFTKKGYLEVHTQNRLSIMAACEDPSTIATYNYLGEIWPLPQTGQMWLEYELLTDRSVPGYFCLSTSYRNEPHPVIGRHNVIFPMFEFELQGGIEELEILQRELLVHLGFTEEIAQGNYKEVAAAYNTTLIEREHELQISQDSSPLFLLKYFPEYTSPFWNMKRNENDNTVANKIDVLIHGMETIGSAERSIDANQMLQSFLTIENGNYANKLYDLFGKDRVTRELDHFLSLPFFTRSGGGIGLGRLIKGMKASNLL